MAKSTRVEFRVEEEIKKEFYELCEDPSNEFRKFMLNFIKREKNKTLSPSLPKKEKPKAEPKKVEEPKSKFKTWEDIEDFIRLKKLNHKFEIALYNGLRKSISEKKCSGYEEFTEDMIMQIYADWNK